MSANDKAPPSAETEERVMVNASPQRCFEVATDFDTYPTWSSDIRKIDVVSRDAEGRGTEVTFWIEAIGRTTSYRLSYDYSHAPQELHWRLIEGDIEKDLVGRYTFNGIGDQTEMSYSLSVDLKVPMPSFVKRRAEHRIVGAALHQLKARAES